VRAYDLCTSFPKTVLADPGQTLAEVPKCTSLRSNPPYLTFLPILTLNPQAGLLNAVIIQQLK
jgi:hypothetical protein